MPKTAEKIVNALFICAVLSAAALRFVQMFLLTDSSKGFIIGGYEATIGGLVALCAVFIGLFGIRTFVGGVYLNPFEINKSKCFSVAGVFAAAALFYDFIHQCINCYNYAVGERYFQLNYFIPLCLAGAAALLSSFYFIVFAVSFNTDKYDFRNFKYFHFVPVSWLLFTLVSQLTRYDDGIRSAESIIYFAVIIFGILFFIFSVKCIDGGDTSIKAFCFFGVIYGVMCLILALPRIAALIFGVQVYAVRFSSCAYLFTGIFALVLCASALKKDKSKEG